jgi:hypothetical protein
MPVDISSLVAAVDRSVGLKASAAVLIREFAANITAAVAAALAADDAADQGSIDAANAAIAAETAKLTGASDDLAAALSNHSTPPPSA